MVKTFRILNGLCPEIWVNKNPWSYDVDELKLLESWVKIAEITLKIKVNEPHFQYQPKVSWGAALICFQLGDSSSNPHWFIVQTR